MEKYFRLSIYVILKEASNFSGIETVARKYNKYISYIIQGAVGYEFCLQTNLPIIHFSIDNSGGEEKKYTFKWGVIIISIPFNSSDCL